jgi:AcrR family transcriptional regulator
MPLRAGLDRERVVRAAADIVDTGGADALTLAAVAARLGVRIPSLYNHVAGLEGLRRELALYGLRLLDDALRSAALGKSGDEAVIAIAAAYRAYVKAHPGVYEIAQRVPPATDSALQAAAAAPVQVALAVLAGYGLSGDDAIHAVRALRSAIHGFVTLEISGGFAMPVDLDESFDRLILILIRGLRDPSSQPPIHHRAAG